MAKISFLLLVLALIAFLHFSEAYEAKDFNAETPKNDFNAEVLEKDLHIAKDLIDEDLKKKEASIKTLEKEVNMLTKSDAVLTELGDAYKSGKNLVPFGKKLKKFNRKIKHVPRVKYVSVIQSILKDLGLNGGRV